MKLDLIINSHLIVLIALTIIIILFSFFFSLLESSVLYIDEIKANALKKKFPEKEKKLDKLIKHKKNHLSAMVVLTTVVSIMGSTTLGALSHEFLKNWNLTLYSIILTYFMLSFAKVLPKLLAISNSEKILMKNLSVIYYAYYIMIPILWMTKLITFWFTKKQYNTTNEQEEFNAIIDFYSKKGVIHRTERSVLEKVLQMKSKKAKDLLNKNSQKINLDDCQKTIEEINNQFNENAPKRIFVTEHKRVCGIIYKKDIVKALAENNGDTQIINIVREPLFVNTQDNLLDIVHRLNMENKTVAVVKNDKNEPVGTLNSKLIYRYLLKNVNLLSTIDFDTGVLSRKEFLNSISKNFDHKNDFSLLFINIENLKGYNEKYGYHQGDIILKDIANTLTKTINEESIIGRIGEGFGIIIRNADEDTLINSIKEDLKHKKVETKMVSTKYSSKFESHLDIIRENNKKLNNDYLF